MVSILTPLGVRARDLLQLYFFIKSMVFSLDKFFSFFSSNKASPLVDLHVLKLISREHHAALISRSRNCDEPNDLPNKMSDLYNRNQFLANK